MTGRCSADSETEIEVTPEMIEAGRDVIASRWLDFISSDEGPLLWGKVLSGVFQAMLQAQR